ncbi:phage tail protein [Cellulomonas phragmiteti]|uniref:Tail Collar domain-containing protein n=1 Tax=Cellulomonas phragmiteti TaxID=478780 RepID=A0ABQ4DMU6_9CELL|nr:tail fiber protein [Cellulomonas phragmiteti]GIG40673.1 tail Collar domain-containing protein [Cellulomonas phragmiteti]
MYDPYLGELRLFAGSFAPRGWAFCEGQIMPIQQNTALFSLLGTNFGGDGRVTFALPDLRNASPVGTGSGPGLTSFFPGDRTGVATVTLTSSQMPAHTHPVPAVDAPGTSANPSGAVWAQSRRGRAVERLYGPAASLVAMSPTTVGPAGAGQPHENMPPYLRVNVCIALQGIFPPRD